MAFQVPPYETCSFCEDLARTRECAFVLEDTLAAVEVDERQYQQGAMLVITRAHRETVLDLDDAEIARVYTLAREVARAAMVALGALGANIYQNNGVKAGQHEPHFHVHVVPRYAHSDPDRRFLQHDYPVISIDAQRAIAAVVRAAL